MELLTLGELPLCLLYVEGELLLGLLYTGAGVVFWGVVVVVERLIMVELPEPDSELPDEVPELEGLVLVEVPGLT